MNAATMIRGDRAGPRLRVQPCLRAANRMQPAGPVSECPLFSRIDGRLMPDGFLPVEIARRLLVAAEA